MTVNVVIVSNAKLLYDVLNNTKKQNFSNKNKKQKQKYYNK